MRLHFLERVFRRARNRQPHVGASLGPVRGTRAAAVRGRNQLGDRESETRSALAPSLVSAAEAIERPRQELLGEAAAAVCDVQLDRLRPLDRGEDDWPGAMDQGVVDE